MVENYHVRHLGRGLSNQPDHLRLEGQVGAALNVAFTVREGIVRRHGTEVVKELTSVPASEDLKLWPIDRDPNERYLVAIGDGYLQVYDTVNGGALIGPTVSTAAQTYLDSGDANADDFRLLSIADWTFIANTKVALGVDTQSAYAIGTVPNAATAGLQYNWYDPTNGTGSSITDTEVMKKWTPSHGTYHFLPEHNQYWQYRDHEDGSGTDQTFATVNGRQMTESGADWNETFTDWDQANGNRGFILVASNLDLAGSSATFTTATKTLTLVGGFAAYTASGGTDFIYVPGGTGVTANWYSIASRTSDDAVVLDDDIGGTNPTDVSFSHIGEGKDITISDFGGSSRASMWDIAEDIETAIQSGGGDFSGIICGYLHESSAAGDPNPANTTTSYFQLTSKHRGADAAIAVMDSTRGGAYSTANPVDLADNSGDQRPFYPGATGYLETFGTGDTATGTTTGATLDVDDRWVQVGEPGSTDSNLTTASMPIKMTRTSAFVAPSTQAVFDVSPIDWTIRLSGTAATNPSPDIFVDGETLSDITMYKGRLGFLAGESFVASQAGDVLNLYNEDALNLVDSDPVILESVSDRVSLMARGQSVNNTVVFLTETDRQYELSRTATFTPTSAGMSNSTSVRAYDADPAILGSVLYFAGPTESGTAVYEYVYDDNAVQTAANDITAHVPELIASDITVVCADSTSSTLLVGKRGDGTIWAYRSHWSGTKKVQESWSQWELPSGCTLDSMTTIAGSAYLIVQDSNSHFIERLPLGDEAPRSGWQHPVFMDRRVVVTGVEAGGLTTFDVSPLQHDDVDEVVLGPAFTTNQGKMVIADLAATKDGTSSGNNFIVSGDYSAGECVLGMKFTSSADLTRPFKMDKGGKPDLGADLYHQWLHVRHSDSGPYTVQTSYNDTTPTATQTFTPATLVESSGEFAAWVLGDADKTTITLTTSGVLPVEWTGLRYEVEVTEAVE